jgi:lysophospholipase L1-like esterase
MAIDSDTIKANNSFIEYTGRIDFSNPLAPKFSYSGVSVRACFQGTCISIILNDENSSNEYNVLVDNVIKRIKVSKGLTVYPIVSGLENTVHEIEIFRLTELTFGETTFNGFIVDKGKSLVAISNPRTHLIEYVGNSITCGYGNEGLLGGTYEPTTENHYLTYAAYNSRNFNARHLAVCRSGIGIYRNYGDSTTGSKDCMTNNYSRLFLYDASPMYNFNLKPDLICIDLGTNDFSNSNNGFVVDTARYVHKYLAFIDTLQQRNKNTDILVLLGPMLSDPSLSTVRRCLNLVVDSANKRNNGKVYFFEMSQQGTNYGIDYHPVVSQHLKNGLELTKYIKQIKGWAIAPVILNADILKANEIIINLNTEVIASGNEIKGFTVYVGGKRAGIKSVSANSKDRTKLHIILSDYIKINQAVSLSYTPGKIRSKDGLTLGKISDLMIINKLAESKE